MGAVAPHIEDPGRRALANIEEARRLLREAARETPVVAQSLSHNEPGYALALKIDQLCDSTASQVMLKHPSARRASCRPVLP